MKLNIMMVLMLVIWTLMPKATLAQETPTPNASADAVTTLTQIEIEKQKLEIERMKLENEKLELEMKGMKAQMTVLPTPVVKKTDETVKMETEQLLADETKKAQTLAKENKDRKDLLILDVLNGEIWYMGAPYAINTIPDIGKDHEWKMTKKVEARSPSGYARYHYEYLNLSFLKYENKDRGILSITAPQKDGDFQVQTPEGISFSSSSSDVRSAFLNPYLSYDGMGDRDGLKVLKYKRPHPLNFDDLTETLFDRHDKMVQIRYGVLGEH
jgi:hypothetical protein